MKFRRDIEGLRGVAILLVLAYHAGLASLAGGYVGVDVFFVLSGFLITKLLVAEFKERGRIDLVGFYARRARRLLPALFVMITVTLVAAAIIASPIEQKLISGGAIASASYLSNLYFVHLGGTYFGPASQANPFLHTWSLAVEEQFYLVWPLILLAGSAAATYLPRRRVFAAAVGAVCALSLVLELVLMRHKQPWAFYLSPPRAWEFAAGGLLASWSIDRTPEPLEEKSSTRRILLRVAAGWIGVVLVLGSAVLLGRRTPFPGIAALLPVTGTLLILATGPHQQAGSAAWVLSVAPLQWVGKLSYSLYLWHWPILVLDKAWGRTIGTAGMFGCLLASFLAATLSYHLVERPIRAHTYLVARPRLSLVLAAAGTATAIALSFGWRIVAARLCQGSEFRQFAAAMVDQPSGTLRCVDGFDAVDPRACEFGESGSRRVVVLWGDSHAQHWIPALRRVAERQHWRLVTFLKSACPVASVEFVYPRLGRLYSECSVWRQAVLARIGALHPYAVILTNSVYTGGASALVDLAEWQAGLRETFSAVRKTSKNVIEIRDNPRPGFDVPSCLARRAWNPLLYDEESCRIFRYKALAEDVFRAEQALAARSNVDIVDLTDAFCGERVCPAEKSGEVVYMDSNHITASFARTLDARLELELLRVLSGPRLTDGGSSR